MKYVSALFFIMSENLTQYNILLSSLEIELATRLQILDQTLCILHCAIAYQKGMTSSPLFYPAIGK